MTPTKKSAARYSVSARVSEFSIPPVSDALVVGRQAPIGCAAFKKALELLVRTPYEHIDIDDDVVSDLLIRRAILRRFPKHKLIGFVLEVVKPMMGAEEVMHLDLRVEVALEADGA